MQDRVRWAMAAVCAAILIGGGVVFYANRHAPPPILITNTVPATPTLTTPQSAHRSSDAPIAPSAAPSGLIYVHVAGAVRNPSLYSLPPGSRVMQAIKAAGGLLNKADLDAVNLAERVQDGEKIYIPRQETHDSPQGNRI